MRHLFGVLCVCALGLMPLVGCSETTGDGGTGGMAGEGGSGGIGGEGGSGGSAGTGGMAGSGGTGGMGGGGTGGMGGSGGSGGIGGAGGGGGSAGTGGMGGIGGSGGTSLCNGVTCADTECKIDGVCDANDGLCDYTLVENGTACSLGECLNGVCAGAITVACRENLTEEVRILPFNLQVEPGPIAAGSPFTAELTGVARFPEFVLDFLNVWVCGGVRIVDVVDLAATVQVRSGAAGADVELGIDIASLTPGPTRFCVFPTDQVCDCPPGTPSDQSCSVDVSVCIAQICGWEENLQDIPVIDGIPLSPGGCDADLSNCPVPGLPVDCDCSACAALDPPGCGTPGLPSCFKSDQCERNGFCVNGDLPLRLEQRTGNYTADPVSGTPILFGWFDGNPPPTNPDGTIQLPEARFANRGVEPIGLYVDASGLAVPVNCLMGVDSGGPYGIGIPDQASPTPDSLLITFLVP